MKSTPICSGVLSDPTLQEYKYAVALLRWVQIQLILSHNRSIGAVSGKPSFASELLKLEA